MPLVSIKVLEGTLTEQQKHALADAIDGTPTTRDELAAQAPVRPP